MQNGLGRAIGHGPPLLQEKHPVREEARQVEVVEHGHHAFSLVGQGPEEAEELEGVPRVQVVGGLVQEEEPGLLVEEPGHLHPHGLAPREAREKALLKGKGPHPF